MAITKGTRRAAAAAAPGPVYTVDWFTEHAPSWERHLGPLRGRPGLRALLVGVYEGRCLEWLFANVMTAPDCSATVVDEFDYPPCVAYEGAPTWNPGVETTFRDNMRAIGRATRVRVVKRPAFDALAAELAKQTRNTVQYDVVYVDARGSRHALETMVMAFRLLKKGGVMVVTNYVHSKEHDVRCPRRGIDAFLDVYSPDVRVLVNRFHTFLQRREAPLHVPPCHSEFYDEPDDPASFPQCTRRSGRRPRRVGT
jgi:hypothetical protein